MHDGAFLRARSLSPSSLFPHSCVLPPFLTARILYARLLKVAERRDGVAQRISVTSCFRRPPGAGAQLEKGAPPPFDPPDLVPRFARPNPELASLALCCFDQEM